MNQGLEDDEVEDDEEAEEDDSVKDGDPSDQTLRPVRARLLLALV